MENFTRQKGGLPHGNIKLPHGSNPMTKHIGGLGGDSTYKSYPKWIKDEIIGASTKRDSEGQTLSDM